MNFSRVISNVGSIRAVRLILTLLAIAVHSSVARAQTLNDHLIVPRERIGPMTLGMSATELAQMMGSPSSRRPGEVDLYSWRDLTATVTKNGLWATQICTFNSAYLTVQGLHVGSTDVSVVAALGKPRYSRVFSAWWGPSYSNLYWPGLMISVHLKGCDNNHSVWKICVNHFAAIAE
ncbi:MAG: hypothetical protein WA889_17765 [Xanthobacteraceae bacterium]